MQYRKGRFVITKAGKPVAAIVDIDLFERIRRLDDELETLTRDIVDAFAHIEPAKGARLVDDAVRAARRKTTTEKKREKTTRRTRGGSEGRPSSARPVTATLDLVEELAQDRE